MSRPATLFTVGVTLGFILACASGGRPEECSIAPTIELTHSSPVDGCVEIELTGTEHGDNWDRNTFTQIWLDPGNVVGWTIINQLGSESSGTMMDADPDGVIRGVKVCGSGTATVWVLCDDLTCDTMFNDPQEALDCSTDADCNPGETCMGAGGDTGGSGTCSLEVTRSFEITI